MSGLSVSLALVTIGVKQKKRALLEKSSKILYNAENGGKFING
tara:strand:+ start:245 stop:373 length:129 start_codon:yes stop_codon:yes gene_type:complete